MVTCRNGKLHSLLTLPLFVVLLLTLAVGGALAQTTCTITVSDGTTTSASAMTIESDAVKNPPVQFILTFTYTSDGSPANVVGTLPGYLTIYSSAGDGNVTFETPFPSGEICDSGNGATFIASGIQTLANVITVTLYPARDCTLYAVLAKESVLTGDDPAQSNTDAVTSPVVTYVDAPRTRVDTVSTADTNSPTAYFKVEFSKPVNGFGTGDVTIGGTAGGTLTGIVTGSGVPGEGGSVYYVGVSGMTYPGTVNISIPQSAAGSASNGAESWGSVGTCGNFQVNYDAAPPTSLIVTTPATVVPTSTYAGTYETSNILMDMAGTADDVEGISSVTWSNDRGGSGTCTGTTSWSQNGIYLKPGQNIITITAYDAAGNSLSYVLTVTCTNAFWSDIADDGSAYDPACVFGMHTSVAVGSDGYPRISYYDSTNNDLKYAAWNGEQWVVETVDGSALTGQAADVGQFTSLKLDSGDNPHISYYDLTNTDLKYAYWKNGAWHIQRVDGFASSTDKVGQYSSLALDSSGKPRIAYYDETNKDLLYAEGSAADNPTWTISSTPVDSTGDVGQYTSLALDSTGKPRISYYDKTNTNLKYAEGSAATSPVWTPSNVDSGANDLGQYSSLALDSTGKPHIAYYDATGKDLKYAEGSAATSPTWTKSTVESANMVGEYCSLALASDGKPGISYYSSTGGNLKYAQGSAASSPVWTLTTIDDGTAEAGADTYDVGKYTSLVIDSNGNPHVSYQDVTNGDLKYIYRIGADEASYPPSCVVTAPSSPAVSTPLLFTVTFSQDVTGFAAGDVVVGNGYVSSVIETTLNRVYRVSVVPYEPNNSNVVSCFVPEGSAANGTLVGNLASNTAGVMYDGAVPSVVINQDYIQSDPTSALPIHFTIVFSEPVYGFTGEDIVIGGTAGGSKTVILSGGGTYYDAAVYGVTTSGSVTPIIPANVAVDASGNGNVASTYTDNTVWYDAVPPTCTINQASGLYGGPTQNDPTNSSTINFTAVFSESVVGFNVASDVLINASPTSGSASFTNGSGGDTRNVVITPIGTMDQYGHYSTYNVAVSGMTSNGLVTVTIPAGAANDCSSSGVGINNNLASTSTKNYVQYDSQSSAGPSVAVNQALGQVDPALTGDGPINFTVVFSAAVTEFTSEDVVLSGTASPTTAVVTGGGTTYNIAVSGMTQEGTVKASIPAGVAIDANGNANTASTSFDNTVQYKIPLTVEVVAAQGQASPAATGPIEFTATFNKAVTPGSQPAQFSSSDVSVSGSAFDDGSTPVVTVTNDDSLYKTYTISVSGMRKPGSVTIMIPTKSVYVDGFGNAASGTATVNYNPQVPTVTVNQADDQADPTNATTVHFTAVFSQPVTDFTSAGVTIGGDAGATTVVVTDSGDQTTYDLAVSGMIQSGLVTVVVDPNVAFNGDNTGNAASTSTDNSVRYDDIRPTATVARATGQSAIVYDVTTINFKVTFSEQMTGFGSSDVVVSGTAGATTAVVTDTGNQITYNVAVTGMVADGDVKISVPANKATDLAGNNNLASTALDDGVIFYNKPQVTINQADAPQADPTNISPVNFTAVFSESVTGFGDSAGDVYIAKTSGLTGTPVAAVTGSGTTYNIAVSGVTGQGTLTVTIPADVAVDAAAQKNAASTSTDNLVTYDIISPTVTVAKASAQASPTNDTAIDYTVTFDEPVVGFAADKVTIGGTADVTSATAIISGSGPVYNVAVSGMTGTGTVTLTVEAGKVTDAAGNSNMVSNTISVDYDAVAPVATIDLAVGQDDPTQSTPIKFLVTFSEPIQEFTDANVVVSGTAGKVSVNPSDVVSIDAATFEVSVDGIDHSGTVIVDVVEGSVLDIAGNGSGASIITDNEVLYDDLTSPTPTVEQAVGQDDPTGVSSINFTVDFGEPVTDFAADDVLISGTADGTKTVIVSGSGAVYNVEVSGMTSSGTVVVDIPAGAAVDLSGLNFSDASTSTDNVVTFDITPPTVSITLAAGQVTPTSASPVNFKVEFLEPVTGFVAADVSTAGSTAAPTTVVVTGVDTTYNVAVSGMSKSGTVMISIPAGAATDDAGNLSLAGSVLDLVVYDRPGPSVTIEQKVGQPDPAKSGPVNFTVVFSSVVTGFATGDVTLSGTAGATTAVVTGSGTTYNVAVSGMTQPGTIIASILADVAIDAQSQYNSDSTSEDNVVAFDNVVPSVTINQSVGQDDPTSSPAINFTVVFSKPVF
ncbi:MAG: Ig-like domain-containing protein, partial [Armatimonadota bacterium]